MSCELRVCAVFPRKERGEGGKEGRRARFRERLEYGFAAPIRFLNELCAKEKADPILFPSISYRVPFVKYEVVR